VLALPLAALERACRRAVPAERHIDGTSSSNSSLSLCLGIVGMLGVLILVMHLLPVSFVFGCFRASVPKGRRRREYTSTAQAQAIAASVAGWSSNSSLSFGIGTDIEFMIIFECFGLSVDAAYKTVKTCDVNVQSAEGVHRWLILSLEISAP